MRGKLLKLQGRGKKKDEKENRHQLQGEQWNRNKGDAAVNQDKQEKRNKRNSESKEVKLELRALRRRMSVWKLSERCLIFYILSICRKRCTI